MNGFQDRKTQTIPVESITVLAVRAANDNPETETEENMPASASDYEKFVPVKPCKIANGPERIMFKNKKTDAVTATLPIACGFTCRAAAAITVTSVANSRIPSSLQS